MHFMKIVFVEESILEIWDPSGGNIIQIWNPCGVTNTIVYPKWAVYKQQVCMLTYNADI